MKRTEFTYGQLDRVLRSLGFTRRMCNKKPPAYHYVHKPSGALVTVPTFPKSDHVLEYHLVATRFILDEYGIADPTEFAKELQKAG